MRDLEDTTLNGKAVLAGLDEQQRAAVIAPAGPVCVLAGAGTGKTRSITHRIAYRALTGEISARHVLAVTFTARAAANMRERLTQIGAPGVQARTFHASALRQVRYFASRLFSGHQLPELIESKARLIGLACARVSVQADRTVARDVASEIEWAKSSLVEPGEYEAAVAKATRDTPLEPSTIAEIYAEYERAKRASGVIDFEDLLRAAVWAIEEHSDIAEQVRAQYRHFVVDEYQDVNPLQQRLLDAWLGDRDDVTVVGDASQTIYSFTGASSFYLIDFVKRYRSAVVVRLVRDYRSTPQIVACANAVMSRAQGELSALRLELIGQRPDGPEPDIREFPDEQTEAAAVATRCSELIASGKSPHEIAILFRTHAQSESYERALAEVGVPYTVHDGERFFERPEVRKAMIALRVARRTTSENTPLREAVVTALEAVAWRPDNPPPGGTAREQWETVNALVGIADDYQGTTLEAFCEELGRRAATRHIPTVDGVTLSSLHSAKGLEWDVVCVVGLTEGTLPTIYAKTPEAVEEERRLLYVGITRAREVLWLSCASARNPGGKSRRPCRFLAGLVSNKRPPSPGSRSSARVTKAENTRAKLVISCRICGASLINGVDRKIGRCSTCPSDIDQDLFDRLRLWRAQTASKQGVPAYVVFTDATLTALAERRPGRPEDLITIGGIGPRKMDLYGAAVLAIIGGASVDEFVTEVET